MAFGAYRTNKLLAKKQESGITFKDQALSSFEVAVLGSSFLFVCSISLDIASSGYGLSEVYLSGVSVFKSALDVMLSLPTDTLVRSSGLAILCFVSSMVVFGFAYLVMSLCCGKKVAVHKSKLACVVTDSQVNAPILLSFSFIPVLVALLFSMSAYTGFRETLTHIELSESRIRHLKSHCEFGSAFVTNTTFICDNKLLSSKRTGVTAFDADQRHVLILWDKFGDEEDVKNYIIIREKGELEAAAQESDVSKLIEAHLSGF